MRIKTSILINLLQYYSKNQKIDFLLEGAEKGIFVYAMNNNYVYRLFVEVKNKEEREGLHFFNYFSSKEDNFNLVKETKIDIEECRCFIHKSENDANKRLEICKKFFETPVNAEFTVDGKKLRQAINAVSIIYSGEYEKKPFQKIGFGFNGSECSVIAWNKHEKESALWAVYEYGLLAGNDKKIFAATIKNQIMPAIAGITTLKIDALKHFIIDNKNELSVCTSLLQPDLKEIAMINELLCYAPDYI